MNMWRRFISVFGDFQQPVITPETVYPIRNALSEFTFRGSDLEVFNWLFSVAPCYPVKSNKIVIMTEPMEFYDTLIAKCEAAQKRIILSSLYLGTGTLEKNLVKTIHNNLVGSDGSLKISILLDFQRGSRGDVNSKTMLLPLLEKFKHSCRISFYHTPHLRGLYKIFLPQRWNELIELQHMKVYLTDDTIIMSGANLSNDYFTNRQDRYILIEDKDLADFYANLISNVQSFCLRLQEDGSFIMEDECPNPYKSDKNVFISYAVEKLKRSFIDTMDEQLSKGPKHTGSSDTWIVPLVQAGKLNFHLDSDATCQIIKSTSSSAKIRIATGYFNLTNQYIEALINDCKANCSLLMAHPNANGFLGAKFPAGGIPDAYSLLAQKFIGYIKDYKQENRFELHEFKKRGWTFHGKGLWYYSPGDIYPSLTLIGSPNFGERSSNRDLETQIAIITTNNELKKNLHNECENLHECSRESTAELCTRKIPLWVKMTVRFFKKFF